MRRLDPQWVASTDEILAQFPSWKNVPLFAPLEGVGTDQKALTEHWGSIDKIHWATLKPHFILYVLQGENYKPRRKQWISRELLLLLFQASRDSAQSAGTMHHWSAA